MQDPAEAAVCWGKQREDSKEQWPFEGTIYWDRVNGRRKNKMSVRNTLMFVVKTH
jgi:hypothetical protein